MSNFKVGIIGYGYIGKAVVNKFLSCSNHHIRILDRNIPNCLDVKEWIQGDFREKRVISNFIKDLDILIHLASSNVPLTSSASIDIKDNVSSMIQILDLSKKLNPNIYIIFASSASVYGNQMFFPITEESLPLPISFYGLEKLSIEHYLRIYNRQFDINYASCRISNPYGRGQKFNTLQGIVSIIKYAYQNNSDISIYGANECTRDLIHISDLADAFYKLSINKPLNRVINVSSGKEIKITKLIKVIEEILGDKVKADFLELRPTDIKRSVLDNKKIMELIEWAPKKDLFEGLEEFFDN
tara:strand:+ start:248 stop:1144 length:897 start_codon:yes stop_codon:yes gene_type:complete